MPSRTLNRIISLVFTSQRTVAESMKHSERIDPFSMLKAETLRFISEHSNPAMADVAEHLCITPPSATSLVNGLVQTGQLKRVRDAKDRRIIRLAITPKGREFMRRAFSQMAEQMRRFFSRLNAAEQRNLVRILEKLSSAYQQ
jgi:DNA-binding MarR family transcriptional regulator